MNNAFAKVILLIMSVMLLFLNADILFSQAASINLITTVRPLDATNFLETPGYMPGTGQCELTWDKSLTSNITLQRVWIHGPQGPGVSLTSVDLPTADEILVIPNLVIGWTYNLEHISIASSIESSGVWATCTPTSALPAPNIHAEPGTTEGNSNTIYFDNNGVVDGVDAVNLTCNVRAGLENFALDPMAATVAESGWIDCKNASQTYSHTFTGLTIGETYFYDVQSKDNDPDPLTNEGLSPYSDVEFSTQFEDTGGGGGGGGGGRPPTEEPECGDGNLDAGEQCDDGNLVDGDGCSSLCEDEAFVDVIFDIKGRPEYRTIIDSTPNLGLNSQLIFFKHGAQSVETDNIALDSYGLKEYQREILTGTYDIALNGEAHNTKIIRDVIILETTERVELDFTFADTFELTAGDTYDDNYINALDIARMLGSYRNEGPNVNDLTKEEIVNAIDIAVLLWNYREEGEYFASSAQ